MNTPTQPAPTKGFAILIKAPNVVRSFVHREGETITITDKDGKEHWSFKNPQGAANPGVTIYDVQIDLLTEREFSKFAQNTWNPGPVPQPPTEPPATARQPELRA